MGDSAFWGPVWLPLAVGAALSLAFEALLLPRPRAFWRREWGANAIHAGLWLVLCAFTLVVWRRPVFAIFNALALMLLLVVVSRVKFQALREPFLVQDFTYFVDAIRHPRLYVPFLGVAGCIAAAIAYALVVWAGLVFEPPLLPGIAPLAFAAGIAVPALVGAALLAIGPRGAAPPGWDPARDLERLGFAAQLWLYARALRHGRDFEPARPPFARSGKFMRASPIQHARPPRPAIVVVQSESYFDPRPLFAGIRPGVLREIDALRSEAASHGRLAVPAWGANTVRTEFAFLTGLGPEALGVHRFDPYARLAARGVPTIASDLRGLGYRTVCVHPYAASFYRRDAIFPKLGFDEFIDVKAFAPSDRVGPYVGDEAVARKVGELLEGATQPLFVHAITMENHGPLHLESVAAGDIERLYAQAPAAGCDELTIYLRHLANADRMAGQLRTHLAARPEGGCLAWFGDHVPILPRAYAAAREPDGHTDYFIWRTDGVAGARRDLAVQDLGFEVLRCAGV